MRKLQIKFPNQIRISGWDFGSSARAMNQAGEKDLLMTYEFRLFAQADPRTVRRSTTERKSMSTKTTLKRISLATVAAMGFGLLSVVPANAGTEVAADIDGLAITTVHPSGRTGVAAVLANTVTFNATAAAGDVPVIASQLVTKPATSTSTVALSFSAEATTALVEGDIAFAAGTATAASTATVTVSANGDYVADETITLNATFTPDVAGTYELVTWYDVDEDGAIDTGETLASKSISVVAGSDAVTATLTQYNSTAATGATGNGSLVKVTLKNSAGAPASLGTLETITASVDAGVVYKINDSTTNANATSVTLNRASFNLDGNAWLNLTYGSAGSQVLTVAGSVGAAVAGINLTKTTTFAASAGDVLDAVITTSNTTGVYEATAHVAATTVGIWHVDYTKSTTIGLASSAGTGDKVLITVTDVSGDLTGLANSDYSTYVTASTTSPYDIAFSLAWTPSAVDDQVYIEVGEDASSDDDIQILAKAATVSAAGDSSIEGTATVRAVSGSAVTVSAVWKNQFGIAAANQAVATSVSGRNAHKATINSVTDSNGRVTYALTDGPLAGVTATSDTITMNGPTNADETFTINWVASIAAGTVTLTGGNTTAGVTATTVTTKDIDAGVDGASTTVHSMAATVKDANGSIIVGVPVTFTISGTGAAVLSTTQVVNTNTSGIATASVYGWVAGTYTVTATAGGKSGTATITFGQTAAGEERSISATADGSVVTAKVVDRFGNPVPSVTVYATKSGAGYFGSGVTRTSTTTNADGIAEFVIAGGAATVTVSTIDYAAVAGTKGSGQTSSLKGYADSATTPTAFTAYAAGTAYVAEEGVGASYDAAGVSSASVDVNASATSDSVDAANEATDAANAATDAANAAAEAADAATAAAQDAQAAVAELATKVASLIAGIKAQITTLTNLVIKIQKKVKA
jgi:hypothetical protein